MGTLSHFDLDAIDLESPGEGSLHRDAKIASSLAEKVLLKQIAQPDATFEFKGEALWLLAHLAQLESMSGLCLFRRNIKRSSRQDDFWLYRAARRCVSQLGPLSPSDWKAFLARNSKDPDFDLLSDSYDCSLVVPCYRPAKFLEGFDQGIRKAHTLFTEILVVSDGNSREDNAQMRALLADIPNLRLIERPENLGPGHARNFGFEQAKTKWVTFLDFDDTLHGTLMKLVLSCACRSKVPALTFHVRKKPQDLVYYARRFSFPDLMHSNQVAVNLILNKERITELGLKEIYNSSLRDHFEDWELNIVLRMCQVKPVVLGLAAYQYLIHEEGRQLSSVDSQWLSRRRLSRLFSRVPARYMTVLRKDSVMQTLALRIQRTAQEEHQNFARSLFLRRASAFFDQVSSSSGGAVVLKAMGKAFQKIGRQHD